MDNYVFSETQGADPMSQPK